MIGYRRAADLMLFGERFDAHKALAFGIVNAVVPATELATVLHQRAVALSVKPPSAIQTTKALLKRAPESVPAPWPWNPRNSSDCCNRPKRWPSCKLSSLVERRRRDFATSFFAIKRQDKKCRARTARSISPEGN